MLNLLISSAQAQEAAAAAQPNPLMSMAPLVIVFVIFYFLMIRPQKKKVEQEQTLLGSLVKGDEVFTKSGMIGVITGLTEKIVTLEVATGIKIKFLRHQVAGKASTIFESKKDEKKS